MKINVSCEKCGDGLEVVRQWAERGDIEITVRPCEYCLQQQKTDMKSLTALHFAKGNKQYEIG